ncbi:MAG: T9SS type A sorting domain-containing protein, partial [Bacteroidales bacterium]|nr:T9SS type A sorting domain-containing protein [Bacteroidales bacterium]
VAAVNKLAGNFTAYQWNENGVALAGETHHYLHRDFSASGVYTATLTLADGSVRETCPLDLTRVNAARRAASVKVYPNPATRDGHVTVEVTENYDPSADKTLSIFSISGAQVKQIPNPQEISTLQLPQGTYTGVYEQNGERTTFKVLVK